MQFFFQPLELYRDVVIEFSITEQLLKLQFNSVITISVCATLRL